MADLALQPCDGGSGSGQDSPLAHDLQDAGRFTRGRGAEVAHGAAQRVRGFLHSSRIADLHAVAQVREQARALGAEDLDQLGQQPPVPFHAGQHVLRIEGSGDGRPERAGRVAEPRDGNGRRRLFRHAARQPVDDFQEIGHANRLGQVTVHPRRQAGLPVALQRTGGDGGNRKMAARLLLERTYGRRGLEPVHLRHVDVEERDVERAVAGGGDRLAPVGHQSDLVAEPAEDAQHEPLVHLVVLRDEDLERPAAGDRGESLRVRARTGRRHQHVQYRVQQVGGVYRLDDVGEVPEVVTPRRLGGMAAGREHHQYVGRSVRNLPDLLYELEAVEAGHAHVEEGKAVGRSGGTRLGERGESGLAAPHERGFTSPRLQRLPQDPVVDGHVIGDQDAQALQGGGFGPGGGHDGRRRAAQAHPEMEGAAVAELALHPDRAAHEREEL